MRFEDATAAILAGGAGTRLGGVSKAFVQVGGRAIVESQIAILRPRFRELLAVAPDPSPFEALGIRGVRDRFPGKGAPGGVHAALEEATTPWVFCLACDMPFVAPAAIELLAARRGDAAAVVPVRCGYPEPLFAFYSKGLAAPFALALQAGNPSLARLLSAAQTVRVAEEELAAVDPGCRSLENVNTPEDLARARRDR